MRAENGAHRLPVAQVGLNKRRTRTGDRFNAGKNLWRTVDKIVGQHDINSRLQHTDGGVAADVARAAGQ